MQTLANGNAELNSSSSSSSWRGTTADDHGSTAVGLCSGVANSSSSTIVSVECQAAAGDAAGAEKQVEQEERKEDEEKEQKGGDNIAPAKVETPNCSGGPLTSRFVGRWIKKKFVGLVVRSGRAK